MAKAKPVIATAPFAIEDHSTLANSCNPFAAMNKAPAYANISLALPLMLEPSFLILSPMPENSPPPPPSGGFPPLPPAPPALVFFSILVRSSSCCFCTCALETSCSVKSSFFACFLGLVNEVRRTAISLISLITLLLRPSPLLSIKPALRTLSIASSFCLISAVSLAEASAIVSVRSAIFCDSR